VVVCEEEGVDARHMQGSQGTKKGRPKRFAAVDEDVLACGGDPEEEGDVVPAIGAGVDGEGLHAHTAAAVQMPQHRQGCGHTRPDEHQLILPFLLSSLLRHSRFL
jgi:hypothetical protein